jgi:predicted outer membrane repeat protein
LSNINFYGNYAGFGGGMAVYSAYAVPSRATLTNVGFYGNSAYFGGGMFNYGDDAECAPVLTNVVFSGNQALASGGGISTLSTDGGATNPTLTNVTFSGNYAVEHGGGIHILSKKGVNSKPDVRNSILWNNQDSSGTGTISATVFLTGSASISLTHSLVQGAGPSGAGIWLSDSRFEDGGNNIDVDPFFITPITPTTAPTTSGDLRLQSSSPAIDEGLNDYITGVFTDLDGKTRVVDGDLDGTPTVDMGAYEYQIPYLYDGYLPFIYR